jgi:hypothetical protein
MPNSWQAEAERALHAEDRPVYPMKLTYFNLRGVVEVARYMLHMGGAEYEDFRYPFDFSNWAKPAERERERERKRESPREQTGSAAARFPALALCISPPRAGSLSAKALCEGRAPDQVVASR